MHLNLLLLYIRVKGHVKPAKTNFMRSKLRTTLVSAKSDAMLSIILPANQVPIGVVDLLAKWYNNLVALPL